MPFNGSGQYSVPSLYNPVISGNLVSSTEFNGTMEDIAGGLSTCVTTDGQSTFSANLRMSGFGIIGLGNGTAGSPAITWGGGDGFYKVGAGQIAVASGGMQYAYTYTGVGWVMPVGAQFGVAQSTELDVRWASSNLLRFVERLAGDGSSLSLGYCDDAGTFVGPTVSYTRTGTALFTGVPIFNSDKGGGYGASVYFKNPSLTGQIEARVNPLNGLEFAKADQSTINFTFNDDGSFVSRGSITGVGSVGVVSLAATKTDIVDLGLDDAIAILQKLRPRRYKLRSTGESHIGLVREETPEELTAGDAVSLYDVVTVLVGAVQKLAQKLS